MDFWGNMFILILSLNVLNERIHIVLGKCHRYHYFRSGHCNWFQISEEKRLILREIFRAMHQSPESYVYYG